MTDKITVMPPGGSLTDPPDGLYRMRAQDYHEDPVNGQGSLSASGVRKLISPSCPARFHHDRINRVHRTSDAFDLGHLAHRLVLGDGPDLEIIGAPDWTRKVHQQQRAAARAAGRVPVLEPQYERALDLATAVKAHDLAGPLFTDGQAEVAGIWREDDGTYCRMLIDWLRDARDPRLIIPDLKTTSRENGADPYGLDRTVWDHGYHIQAAWYTRGAQRLRLAERVAFVWVVVEIEPPYLITVAQPNETAMRIGAIQSQQALAVYRECTDTGRWPSYSTEIEHIGLPTWVEYEYAQERTR